MKVELNFLTGYRMTGKTTWCIHNICEALKKGKKVLYVTFNQTMADHVKREVEKKCGRNNGRFKGIRSVFTDEMRNVDILVIDEKQVLPEEQLLCVYDYVKDGGSVFITEGKEKEGLDI